MATADEVTDEAPFEASLLSELPQRLQVGRGTVLYLEGHCDPGVEPGSVEIALGSIRRRVDAERMPEPGELGPGGGRWWVLLELPAGTSAGLSDLWLHARLGGREVGAPLGAVSIAEEGAWGRPPPSVVATSGRPLITICMATWEPEPERLQMQVESLRAQDWPEWVCVVSDDASSAESFAALTALVGDDPRFVVSRSDTRLGFYRNFERALGMVPVESAFVALADQDDRWDPDKLTRLHATLTERDSNMLAYSDMRITDPDGEVISDTYWFLRSNRWDDIASLLVANTVTGAASLFRRELLGYALPFPPPPPAAKPYHDHWLALCALAAGDLAYLDAPTYDRVRHPDSVTAETRHARVLRLAQDGEEQPVRASARSLAERLRFSRGWRSVYFGRYLLLAQFARVLELRVGSEIASDKRSALGRIESAERSQLAAAWLGARSFRHWLGRDETMARERVLLGGVLWRRLAASRLPLGPLARLRPGAVGAQSP